MMLDIQPALSLSTALVPTDSTDSLFNSGNSLDASMPSSGLLASSLGQELGTLPTAVANGSGLLGQYYNNLDLTNLGLTRTDPAINFNWSNGTPPGTGIIPTDFSVRWTGKVETQYSEAYTFYTVSDDGIRLWVDGQALIDNWTDHGATENSGTIRLVAGKKYDIKIEYYQASGGATAQLLWSSSSQPKGVISQSQLYEPDLALPTANLPPLSSDAVTGSATYSFTVVYSDLTGVSRETIDNQDILVTGPNNFSQLATLVNVSNNSNASSLTATYQINAPGGVWNASVVGLYTIALQVNQVSDTDGNSILATTLGTFKATVTPPKASLNLLSPVTQRTTSYVFRVDYEGQTPLNRATIDNQDILVTGPNNFSQVAKFGSSFSNSNGSSLTASYTIAAPGGVWDAADVGTYTFTLQANQVSDTSNNFISTQTLGTVGVDFSLPTANLVALTPVMSGSAEYSFSVTYSDDVGVKLDTIDGQDILVSGPNNFSQLAALLSVNGTENGSPLTAVYSIDSPSGIWSVTDQGNYTLTLQLNQVSDTNNNFVPTSALGTLHVDFTPPVAKLITANLAVLDTVDYTFTVLYQDDTAIKRSTITSQNVLVNGPNNFSQIASLVGVNNAGDAGFLTTYRITAPGGVWDATDAGTYTFTLQANQISDTSNNFIPATMLGTLLVDLTPSTATLAPLPFVIDGSTDYQFAVVYRDSIGVKRSTITNQNLLVTGPNSFSQLATLVSVSSAEDDSPLTATYRITAPGGVWDSLDTGTYAIALQANQVSDTSNNFIPAAALGTLPVDLTIPTATLSSLLPVTDGSTDYQFVVVYRDSISVKRSTITNQNLLVTGPNSFSQLATLVSVSSAEDGSPLTATYRITAPGGVWDSLDTGTYAIALQANQVSDTSNNFIPAAALGTLPVNLTVPTATLLSLLPVLSGSTDYQFAVVYRDSLSIRRNQEILVTGPKNFSQQATLISVSSAGDGSPLTVSYCIAAPGGVWDSSDTGIYTITLRTYQVSASNDNFSLSSVLGTVPFDLLASDFNGAGKTDVLV